LVALIKPQFEVRKDKVGKGGVVRDESARQEVVADLTEFIQEQGFTNIQVTESPITGSDGNVEYLITGFLVVC
jgi:23S rRNA (cytidine1920-2'-O)/16S rRNA (cytidine1409-2'-O)-methyltransferase